MGKVKVEYVSIEDSDRDAEEHPYTVPIPEDLTEDFEPSKPVTREQMIRWMTRHIEPYPGYAEEEGAWERAWQEVELAQLKADGEPVLEMDPVHLQMTETCTKIAEEDQTDSTATQGIDSENTADDINDEDENDYADGLGFNPFATLREIMDADGEGPIDPDSDLQ
ncbi:hypothetical protein [Bifidobacterium ramosum]|nr:hypothetical protein [Bifidobacterium ramosum]NEG71827.1 hypothetical protein [Bifidobacterium ramosum]